MSHEEIWEELAELRQRDNLLLIWLNEARKETRELRATIDRLTGELLLVQRAIRPAGWWDMIEEDLPEDGDELDRAAGAEASAYDADRLPGQRRVFIPEPELEAAHG